MDCVTCILVGMCVICGRPGIGAKSPGRPMTETELNQALVGLVRRYQPQQRPAAVSRPGSSSYTRRQSFIPDVRFAHVGIGKRKAEKTIVQTPEQQQLDNSQPHWSSSIQTPSSSFPTGNDPAMPNLELTQLLFMPAINRQLVDFKKWRGQSDVGEGSGEESTLTGKWSQQFNRFSNRSNISSLMKKLKRSKLEQLLLKDMARYNRLTRELDNANSDDGQDVRNLFF